MSLDSIVKVNITRDTKVPTQKGFGIPAILSSEASIIANLVTSYSSDTVLEDLIADGFTSASEVYKWASATIAQNPKVETLKVIQQTASVVQVDTNTVDTIVDETTYTDTINGELFEFVSGVGATDAQIVAGLIALINGSDQPVTAAPGGGTDDYTLTADNAGEGFSNAVDANQSIVLSTPNNGPVEDIVAARDEDDDWYFLMTSTSTNLQATIIAAYIETQIKLFCYQTDDANSKDLVAAGDITSLMAILKAKNYDRSLGVWVPTADLGEYKQAAWVGIMAPKDPGSATWKFKEGKAITANSFTAQEKKNIEDKSGNIYITVAGLNMFQEGVCASGEFADIMRGTDWIQARIQEQVFGLVTSQDKVPYDDGGIESIGVQVEDVLDRAVDRTILLSADNLDDDGNSLGPVVTVPKRVDTTKADRAARFLRDVKFTGFYAGAIHKIQIDGILSV